MMDKAPTIVAVVLAACLSAQAVNMEWVTVGDAGNVADTELMNDSTTGYGSVATTYNIGKYAVTNGQYIEFLDAVAKTDSHGLYDTNMGGGGLYDSGGITRYGSAGNYSYGAKGGDANWLNKPVNWVSWYNSLRFANWMEIGKENGSTSASKRDPPEVVV